MGNSALQDEKRKFPRYNVTNHDRLKGFIDKNRHSEKLVTIAVAGCGFYGWEETLALQVGKRVWCVFEMNGVLKEPVIIQGAIVYANPIQVNGKSLIYYGVEFIEEHRERVQPIITNLATEQKQTS